MVCSTCDMVRSEVVMDMRLEALESYYCVHCYTAAGGNITIAA